MRAVFSAMRRSFARAVIAFASSRHGARSTSRVVSRTGILASRTISGDTCSSSVMARAPLKAMKGSRHPGLPFIGTRMWVRRATWVPADLYLSTVLLGRSLRHRIDGYEDAAFGFGSVLDVSGNECKQRVILAHADVVAGMPLGAALAHENIAGKRVLAAEQLHAKAPARRIAAVARGSACFLVSHTDKSLSLSPYTDSATESSHIFSSQRGDAFAAG